MPEAQDGVEGRPHLVAHVGQEPLLRAGSLGLGIGGGLRLGAGGFAGRHVADEPEQESLGEVAILFGWPTHRLAQERRAVGAAVGDDVGLVVEAGPGRVAVARLTLGLEVLRVGVEEGGGLPNDLRGRPSKDPFERWVDVFDDPVEIGSYDRVRGRVEDAREAVLRAPVGGVGLHPLDGRPKPRREEFHEGAVRLGEGHRARGGRGEGDGPVGHATAHHRRADVSLQAERFVTRAIGVGTLAHLVDRDHLGGLDGDRAVGVLEAEHVPRL